MQQWDAAKSFLAGSSPDSKKIKKNIFRKIYDFPAYFVTEI
jgi:hypothetical protein